MTSKTTQQPAIGPVAQPDSSLEVGLFVAIFQTQFAQEARVVELTALQHLGWSAVQKDLGLKSSFL